MSLKAPIDHRPKTDSKRRPPETAAKNFTQPLQRQIDPAAVIQRARLDPRSLTPGAVRQLQQTIGNRSVGRLLTQTAQRQPTQSSGNETGLPDNLKTGIETLSGLPMDDVRVHYNSAKPAQVLARAYTQGTTIHVRRGQERYLAHEAWHVVQQKQGRVKPTRSLNGVRVNDNRALEQEADRMGDRAIQRAPQTNTGMVFAPVSGYDASFAMQLGAQPATGGVVQMNGFWEYWEWVRDFMSAAANLKSVEAVVGLIQKTTGLWAALAENVGAAGTSIGAAIPLAIIEFWDGWKANKEAQGVAETRRAKGKMAKAVANLLGAIVSLLTLIFGSVVASGVVSLVWAVIVEGLGNVFTEAWASMGEAGERRAFNQIT